MSSDQSSSVVKELCGEGLQLLSTALGIHFGFWEWVISDDASDGFWLNTHSESIELFAGVWVYDIGRDLQTMAKFCPLICLASNSTPRRQFQRLVWYAKGD
jgi:putative SOS response-associated peptidase YedK